MMMMIVIYFLDHPVYQPNPIPQ